MNRVCKQCNEEIPLTDEYFYCEVKEGTKYYKKTCKECIKENKRNKLKSCKPSTVITPVTYKPSTKPVTENIPVTYKPSTVITPVTYKPSTEYIPVVYKPVQNTYNSVKSSEKVPKIPSTMNEVLSMVNGKKYDNPNNKNVELIMYSAIVGFKKLFGNKKKPVKQEKQKINHVSKNSFGSAMYYDNYNITLK